METYPSVTTIIPEVSLISSSDSLDITQDILHFHINKSIKYWWVYGSLKIKNVYDNKLLDFLQKNNLSNVYVKVKFSLYNQNNQLLEIEEYKFDVLSIGSDDVFSKVSKVVYLELCISESQKLRIANSFYYNNPISVDVIINDILNKISLQKSNYVFHPPSNSNKYNNVFLPYNTAIKNIAYVINNFGYSNIFTCAYLDYDGFRIINIEKSLSKTSDCTLSLLDNSENAIQNFGGYVLNVNYENNLYLSKADPTVFNIVKPNIEPTKSNDDFYTETQVDLKDTMKKYSQLLKDVNSNYKHEYYKLYSYSSNNIEASISGFIDSERLIVTFIPTKLKQWYVGKAINVNVVTDFPYYYKGVYIITDIDINVTVSESNQPITNTTIQIGRITL